jgi:O-methyltransferase
MDKLSLRTKAKRMVSRLARDSSRMRYLAYLGRFEDWLKARPEKFPTFDNRYLMYNYLNEKVLANSAIDYLEFGVSKGESLKHWTDTNTNPNSRFFGFDTFTGLPEKWEVFTTTVEQNMFSMDGKPPEIDDARNSFVIGKFQDTLGDFLKDFTPRNRLVVHNDADLYTSTLFTLCECNSIMPAGTIVMFDEFTSVLHEFRAWEDYTAAYGREYTVLAATNGPHDYFAQIAVEMK